MNNMTAFYLVSNTIIPNLNGKYYLVAQSKSFSTYKLHNQEQFLQQSRNGTWEITKHGVTIASATKSTISPTQATVWQYYEKNVLCQMSLLVEYFNRSPTENGFVQAQDRIEVYRGPENDNATITYVDDISATPNVSAHDFSCSGTNSIQVFTPLSNESAMGNNGNLLVTEWLLSVELWEQSVELLKEKLLAQQKTVDNARKRNPVIHSEMSQLEANFRRKNAELQALSTKEQYATQREKTMNERMGRVHVKRDEAQAEEGAFPSGEQIKARYQSVFGEAFERAGVQVIAFIEDTSSVEDGTEIFVREVVAPLFTATRAHALNAIQAKYRKLADAFGLPEVEEEGAEDSIARHFFLTSQQAPLLAATKNIDEAAVLAICKAMGPRAEAVRTQMPAWAANTSTEMCFDLLEMVRVLVWVNTAIELSDPKCYLYPHVGSTGHYVDDKRIYKEVHSPGIKMYGPLVSGDAVEVVVPGLYFEVPTKATAEKTSSVTRASLTGAVVPAVPVVPVVPVQVRRLGRPERRDAAGMTGKPSSTRASAPQVQIRKTRHRFKVY